jgi:hypothetical protein
MRKLMPSWMQRALRRRHLTMRRSAEGRLWTRYTYAPALPQASTALQCESVLLSAAANGAAYHHRLTADLCFGDEPLAICIMLQVTAKDFEADLVQFLEGIGEDRLAKNVRGKHVGW